MSFKTIAANYLFPIKVASIFLIAGAIGLEAWTLFAKFSGNPISVRLMPAIWFGGIALSIHAIEGLFAAAFARSQNKQPLRYGFYTFWVGTVGLLELFAQNATDEAEAHPPVDGS